MSAIFQWYAIRVKSNFEKPASVALCGRGLEAYLPLYRRIRSHDGRLRVAELPLFPGYLFSRFDPLARADVVTVPGFLHIVSVGRAPAPVDPHELAVVQAIVASGLPAERWPGLAVGERILISAGPLRGLEGVVLEIKTRFRLIASVSLLQRSVAVEIDRGWIGKVGVTPVRALYSGGYRQSEYGFRAGG